MPQKKIIFRADANTKIGLGHVTRSLALAQMLRYDFSCIFATCGSNENQRKEIESICSDIIELPDDDSHLDYFLSILNGDEIVVLDNYFYNSSYQRAIKHKGCRLVCIDDIHDREIIADLVINHAPGIKHTDYQVQPYTQFALGLDYALLRPVFLEYAKKKIKTKKAGTVFICFGGSDYKNHTETALKVVLDFNQFEKIIVVTGSAYGYLQSLDSLMQNNPRVIHYHAIDEHQMLAAMQEAELSIVPSSGILLEVLITGSKVISGIYEDNQKFVYTNHKQANCFIDAADFSQTSLKVAIEKSFGIKTKELRIIDGNSNKRLLKLFIQLTLKDQLKLRRANDSDLEITYKWATDKTIRAFSFQQQKITIGEHTDWFQRKIKDNNCIYLIAEMDKQLIGSIRFDISQNEALISYLISSEFHGQGLGLVLLTNGLEYLTNNNIIAIAKKIIGHVIPANIPSVKAFERLGFVKLQENNNLKFEMKLV